MRKPYYFLEVVGIFFLLLGIPFGLTLLVTWIEPADTKQFVFLYALLLFSVFLLMKTIEQKERGKIMREIDQYTTALIITAIIWGIYVLLPLFAELYKYVTVR